MWELFKDDQRMIFKIPMGKMDPEEAKKDIAELMSIYKEDIKINDENGFILPNNEAEID